MLLPTDLRVGADMVRVPWAHHLLLQTVSEQSPWGSSQGNDPELVSGFPDTV